MRREDTIILGGGPAGSAAAITLAKAGERPLVLERQRETGDALCGGFLSWHSLALLERLGIEKLRGATVDHVRLFSPNGSASARLPRPALGLSRRQLDSRLLAHAEALGARVEREVTARALDGCTIRTDGETFAPDRLLLATGKHDVRGGGRPKPDGDPALGLRVRLGPAPALTRLVDGAIELHLFDRGYAGLVLQEDGSANLCLAVRKSRLNEAGGPRALLHAIGRDVPALGERLAWLADQAAIDAIASVPYGWRATGTTPGVYRLGDQAGVMPSLAGEGMGIALTSGLLAGEAVLAGRPAEAFQRDLARRTGRPIAVARAILAFAERPPRAPLLVRTMRLAPGLATLLARATRVGH
ncbi:NAD(P)/FAD-dependent oxidoreductase [Sphingomonas changbaiensis]|uniref:NAD(P)/FAD-dependent oxidoreductase n=1 Tax=Sphingomonas changbaiensis TaxID=529705 RepID=UPI00061CDF9F|nr:FAD-dependent monooxygenase [Sphingomonas changbaiensis]